MGTRHHITTAVFGIALSATAISAPFQTWSPAWGGEGRSVHVWTDPSNSSHLRVWQCEDGARIRYMDTGSGTWSYLARPTTVIPPAPPFPPLQSLLGIYSPDGENVYAVGRDGQYMRGLTSTGAWTLESLIMNSETPTPEPARLWGIRFFSANGLGFLSGEHVLRSTQSGGVPATEAIYDVNSGYSTAQLEFYSVATVGTASNFRAVVMAEGGLKGPGGIGVLPHQGVGTFWTRDEDKQANNSYRWHRSSFTYAGGVVLPEDFEAWAASYVPGASSPDTAVGYFVGGTLTDRGRLFRTANGGESWTEELTDAGTGPGQTNTLYSVHAFSDGTALACGYGGHLFRRDAATGVWIKKSPFPPIEICNQSADFTGPLTGVCGDATDKAWVGGTWGYLWKTVDRGVTFQQVAANGSDTWRLAAVAATSASECWIAGQAGICKSTDGGSTWAVKDCFMPTADVRTMRYPSLAFSPTGNGIAVGEPFVEPLGTPVHAAVLFKTSGQDDWVEVFAPSGTDEPTFLSDVRWVENETFWAVGHRDVGTNSEPMVIRITIAGSGSGAVASWTELPPPLGFPKLTSIAFLVPSSYVYIVGSEFDGSAVEGKAYRGAVSGGFTSGSLTLIGSYYWKDVSPDPAVAGVQLNAIDSGVALPVPEVYAAGHGGVVVRWSRIDDKFLALSGADHVTTRDLYAIDLFPVGSSSTVFIGGAFGAMLKRQAGTWSLVDSDTSKDIYGFSFLSTSAGFAVGGSATDESGSSVGVIADSVVMRYQ